MKAHMLTFFRTLYQSVYSPTLYRSLVPRDRHRAWVYFGVLSVIHAAVLFALFVPLVWSTIVTYSNIAVDEFPSELVVTVEEGEVTKNIPGPVYLYNIEELKEDSAAPTYLAVIDTEREIMLDELEQYDARVIIGQHSIVMLKDQYNEDGSYSGRVELVPLKDVESLTIDQATLEDWHAEFMPLLKVLFMVFAVVIALCAALFGVVYYALAALFGAVLVLLIAGFFKKRYSFAHAYAMACFMSLPLIVLAIVSSFVTDLPGAITLLFFMLIAFVNLRALKVSGVPPAVQPKNEASMTKPEE